MGVKETTTWYVAFTNQNTTKRKIHKFLKHPFYHCYCFRDITPHTYIVDPTYTFINSKILHNTSAEEYAKHLTSTQKNTIVLQTQLLLDFENSSVYNVFNMVPSCVTVVKMFLGIKTLAFTPYMLFRYLSARASSYIVT